MLVVAFWLFMAVPITYLRLLHSDYGLMSVVAWVGLVCLAGGLITGFRGKRKGLLWFLVPFLLGHLYLIFQLGLGFALPNEIFPAVTDYLSIGFAVIGIGILVLLFIRLKGARIPAASLSVFCCAYGLIAVSISYM